MRETKVYLAARGIYERFPDTCSGEFTLYNWMNNPSIAFPRPVMTVAGRRLWLLSDIEEWERQRACDPAERARAEAVAARFIQNKKQGRERKAKQTTAA